MFLRSVAVECSICDCLATARGYHCIHLTSIPFPTRDLPGSHSPARITHPGREGSDLNPTKLAPPDGHTSQGDQSYSGCGPWQTGTQSRFAHARTPRLQGTREKCHTVYRRLSRLHNHSTLTLRFSAHIANLHNIAEQGDADSTLRADLDSIHCNRVSHVVLPLHQSHIR